MRPISPPSPVTTTCWPPCSATSPRLTSASERCKRRSRSPAKTSSSKKRRSPSRRQKCHGGTATKLDVYQAENVLAATEATIPQLTIQLASEPLDNLLGRSIRIPVPPRDVAVGIPADLVRRRPDIRAAELAAAVQSAPAISAHPDDLVRLRTGGRATGAGNRSRGQRSDILGAQRPQRHHRLNLPRGAVRPLFFAVLQGFEERRKARKTTPIPAARPAE